MKTKIKYILLPALFLLFSHSVQAQFDTLNTVLKPRIGVGTGTMSYFGEIQSYQSGFTSTINRLGGNLMVNAPLNKAFNFEFLAVYGKVSAHERTLTRNFNFESRIRMGSLNLQYNFYPFFSPTRSFWNPYVGLGITSFEFLSKSDLLAANGKAYHYWSDGSIMDLAEDDPNAINANPLVRDYKYETDLRSQDLDSLGRYREQSFAIPISIGFEMHLTPRIDFRLGTTLNYTFTDLIDNISPAGEGIRKGDKRNDFILYSNIGLSYDLEFFKGDTEFEELEGEEDLLAYDQTDWDQDGVIDAIDDCFDTPLEALVDEHGCPIDTDKDGVDDYFDEENTPLGNHVDQYGVTIPESEFLKWQQIMIDSTGIVFSYDTIFSRKDYTAGRPDLIARAEGPSNRKYVVIVGKEHKSISANELHSFLGYTEFETVQKGDTVYYVMGKYDNIEDAVAARSSLENEGVAVEAIGKTNSKQTDFIDVNEKVVEKIEKIIIASGKTLPSFSSDKPSFRIQIGSFTKPVDINTAFPGVENITFAKGQDGLIRYYSGLYNNYRDAKKAVSILESKGVDDTFIVAYKNTERVTLKEANVLVLPKGYDEQKELNTFVEPRDTNKIPDKPKINPFDVKYQVLLGSFTDEVPINIIEKFLSIGGIRPVKSEDGATNYYSKKVNTLREAENLVENYKGYELNDLSIVVLYKGKYYTLEEFEKKKR